MTNRAYIVVNEEQEQGVLDKVYKKGKMWPSQDGRGNYWSPVHKYVEFPYVIVDCGKRLIWTNIDRLTDEEIVFDGRKEDNMSEKYVVSQVFMNELKGWKHDLILEDAFFVSQEAINNMPKIIKNWWVDDYVTIGESNKRLISIIRYMSGANDFEVEKPKKWVVKSKNSDINGRYHYSILSNFSDLPEINYYFVYDADGATKFDTKEEAQSWANAHQEVVEVVDV